jgi:succinate dehydrogenase / fumarate reductase, cytochrome b subunit
MLDMESRSQKHHSENRPSPKQMVRWLDLRNKEFGSWAFLLNRITALGLTFYLGLHLLVLNKLAQGPHAYDDFVAFSHSAMIKFGEVILIVAVLFHGLNGLRVILHAFGVGLGQQKLLFAMVVLVTIFISILFAVHLFGA